MPGDFDESEPTRGELKEAQVHAMWDALDATNTAAEQAYRRARAEAISEIVSAVREACASAIADECRRISFPTPDAAEWYHEAVCDALAAVRGVAAEDVADV